jgi:hypothetical protein
MTCAVIVCRWIRIVSPYEIYKPAQRNRRKPMKDLRWNERAENSALTVKIYYIMKTLQRDSKAAPTNRTIRTFPKSVVIGKTLQNSLDESTYGLSLLLFCCQVRWLESVAGVLGPLCGASPECGCADYRRPHRPLLWRLARIALADSHGALEERDILTRGDAMNPAKRSAVLRFINSYAYATLTPHTSTKTEQLDGAGNLLHSIR